LFNSAKQNRRGAGSAEVRIPSKDFRAMTVALHTSISCAPVCALLGFIGHVDLAFEGSQILETIENHEIMKRYVFFRVF